MFSNKNFNKFFSLVVALGLLLGLAVVGCSDDDRDTGVNTKTLKYAFRQLDEKASEEVPADAVTIVAKADVGSVEIAEADVTKLQADASTGMKTAEFKVSTKANVLTISFKNKDGEELWYYDFNIAGKADGDMISDEDIVVPTYTLVADFSQVTLFTADENTTAKIGEAEADIDIEAETATVDKQAAGDYDVVFTVDGGDSYKATEVVFDEEDAVGGVITVELTDYDFKADATLSLNTPDPLEEGDEVVVSYTVNGGQPQTGITVDYENAVFMDNGKEGDVVEIVGVDLTRADGSEAYGVYDETPITLLAGDNSVTVTEWKDPAPVATLSLNTPAALEEGDEVVVTYKVNGGTPITGITVDAQNDVFMDNGIVSDVVEIVSVELTRADESKATGVYDAEPIVLQEGANTLTVTGWNDI